MSVEAMLFDRSKYIKVTKNDWILVGISGKTPIEVQNNNDAGQETIERHTSCLAWVTTRDKYYYTIKDFVGDVYKYNEYSHMTYDQFNNYLASKTLTVKKDEVIGFAV